eukprot:CAMPEP_0119128270 /NCGR_PEP_ID=MMETSP1310-20130426/6493_1 /TAXON_ID=464262 /ORGANISM="Genus nov. species nov., Strain RCC2339" /LENGTH=716 /DNA_ID=CAMNT_0007118597 /DNA_START=48 /DNA_END=2194 /DNA_ORIENTATION=-
MSQCDVENAVSRCVREKLRWGDLPMSVKELFDHSVEKWKEGVLETCLRLELPYKGSLARHVTSNEKGYYDTIVKNGLNTLQLYPYHIGIHVCIFLQYTPFRYYKEMLESIMKAEQSYDVLPNFTAIDMLRLTGVGRNEYIDMMNKLKIQNWFLWRRKKHPIHTLLPSAPVETMELGYWWRAHGLKAEDVTKLGESERRVLEVLKVGEVEKGKETGKEKAERKTGRILGEHLRGESEHEEGRSSHTDEEGQAAARDEDGASYQKHKKALRCGNLPRDILTVLYRKDLIFCSVPIKRDDLIVVPSLKGFVMNRTTVNTFEPILYKVLFALDERTTPEQLANLLQIDLSLVKRAISLYCRLGFAQRRNEKGLLNAEGKPTSSLFHSSWILWATRRREKGLSTVVPLTSSALSPALLGGGPSLLSDDLDDSGAATSPSSKGMGTNKFRCGFVFDSRLTAFLMMGNLTSGLKTYAVTLFEQGKLIDSQLCDFLRELDGVRMDEGELDREGEAQTYFDHAINLRSALRSLRGGTDSEPTREVEMIRIESMTNVERDARQRLLEKNYDLLISVSPLTPQPQSIITGVHPPHLGPPIQEVMSVWFRLYLYSHLRHGPTAVLIPKGRRLLHIPAELGGTDTFFLTNFTSEGSTVSRMALLPAINEQLRSSPVLVQVYNSQYKTVYRPLPWMRRSWSSDCLNLEGRGSLERTEESMERLSWKNKSA